MKRINEQKVNIKEKGKRKYYLMLGRTEETFTRRQTTSLTSSVKVQTKAKV